MKHRVRCKGLQLFRMVIFVVLARLSNASVTTSSEAPGPLRPAGDITAAELVQFRGASFCPLTISCWSIQTATVARSIP